MHSKYKEQDRLEAQAEETAVAVLTWLASEPEMLGRFLSLTGMRADTLRDSANDPGFYLALLDFLMNHEPTLIAYCEATGTPPERVVVAHRALAGHPGLDTNNLG